MRKYLYLLALLLLIPAIYVYATDGVSTVEHPAKVNSVATPDKVSGVSGLAAAGLPTPTAWYLVNNDVTDETTDHDATAVGSMAYDNTLKMEGTHAAWLDTDPADEYFYVADHADFEPGAGDWSFSCWYRSAGLTTNNTLLGKVGWNVSRKGYCIWTVDADADELHVIIYGASATDDIDTGWAPTVDTWYHLAFSFDASEANELTIWGSEEGGSFGDQINGTTYNSDNAPEDTAAQWQVGHDAIDATNGFGRIDDVRWWKGTAISAANAEALYDLY